MSTSAEHDIVKASFRASILAKGSWMESLIATRRSNGLSLAENLKAKDGSLCSHLKNQNQKALRCQVQVKSVDMKEEILHEAIQFAIAAINSFGESHRDIARTVKEQMDAAYCAAWQCIVGQKFGMFSDNELNDM